MTMVSQQDHFQVVQYSQHPLQQKRLGFQRGRTILEHTANF